MAEPITEAQFNEWKTVREEITPAQRDALDTLIDSPAGKQPQEIQAEFDSFLDSLPPNFRTGLSKIVDVRNLMPEQLRGLLIADSINGMDEIIRAAQYGSAKDSAVNLNAAQQLSGHDAGSVHGNPDKEDAVQQPIRDARHDVSELKLSYLTPSHGGTTGPERDKNKGGPGVSV